MKRCSAPFALSSLSVLIALSFSSSYLYAQTGDVPECTFTNGSPIYANPHCVINLSSETAEKYSGEGVKLGLVDEGFILSHESLQIPNIKPLTFTLQNSIAKREDNFDPRVDYTERDEEGSEGWSTHGGATSGVIVAKSREFPRPEYSYDYEGGVAKNATLYVASAAPVDRSGNEAAVGISDTHIFTAQPAGSFYDYYLARYAGGIQRVLAENPLAVNLSINVTPDFKTAEQADAKYRSAISQHENSPFIQAIKKGVEQDTLMVFATGNEYNSQPGILALLPRYIEGLNKHFIAATALPLPIDPNLVPIADLPNKCGIAKEWCITAPGAFLTLTMRGAEQGQKISRTTENFGTSLAAPVVTGSLAIIKQRFDYFKPTQVRDTLFTTATDIGDVGVDDVYGWGLVNIESAIKGPKQLLGHETYTVNVDDQWDNPLNANGYTFTKSGANRLALAGNNQLANVSIQAGTLALNGESRSSSIENHARLEIGQTLNSHIRGSMNSDTVVKASGHWIMPSDSRVGNVTIEQGGQITLNPANAQAGGKVDENTAFNTLVIDGQLSGNGVFNFLTRVQEWVGDRVLVNGIATGDFKLNVQNSGAEPQDLNRLTLLALRHGAQDEYDVNVQLVNPVDLGAYRYELVKTEQNEYRLYNPRKEQELLAAYEEEERRLLEEEEAARQAQAEALAQAQQLAETEKQLREMAENELTAARRTQASQAQALSQAQENLLASQRLAETIRAQLEAEQAEKAKAESAANNLRLALSAQQMAADAAMMAKEKAEQAQTVAESEKAEALRQAEQAIAEAAQKAEQARLAQARATEAEAEKQQAQAQLEALNQQLNAEKIALEQAKNAQVAAEQALQKQSDELSALQQAREAMENALQSANQDIASALKQAQIAQQLAQQKSEEAEQARQLASQAVTQLAQAQSEVETARKQAEQARTEATLARDLAEQSHSELLGRYQHTENELHSAQQMLALIQQQLAEKAKEAEQANQAREQAQLARERAEQLATLAEQEKARAQAAQSLAENAKLAAEQAAKQAELAKADAQTQALNAQNAKAQAEAEKQAAESAQIKAEQALLQAQQQLSALNQAQQAQEQAAQDELNRVQQQAREAQEALAQLQSMLDNSQEENASALLETRLQLSQAQQALAEKERDLSKARLAVSDLAFQRDSANAQVQSAETALKEVQLQLATAQLMQQKAEAQALEASVAQTNAEREKQLAEQAEARAQTQLLNALAAQAKAEAENAAAQADVQAALLRLAQIENEVEEITNAHQALTSANQALSEALSAEQRATFAAEQAQTELRLAQQQAILARDQMAQQLEEAQQQLALKVQESEVATLQAEQARQALEQAELTKANALEQARLAQLAQTQAQADKAVAEEQAQLAQLAQAQAEENARLAMEAQAQAEAEKVAAEAESMNALMSAEQAVQEAEAAVQVALAAAELAQAEAEQALMAQTEAENAQQAAENEAENATNALQAEYARQAQQAEMQTQADLISRYANSALSELSSQVNALEQISYSLNQHLREQPSHLSVWTEYQQQNLNQASEHYRRFKQDSRLTQLGINVPLEVDNVNTGVIFSDVRTDADFDDNARAQNSTKMVSGFVQVRLTENTVLNVDLGMGGSRSKIHLDGENVSFKRDLFSTGAGLTYTAEALGLSFRPSVGVRYHRLGPVEYTLGQAHIESDELSLFGMQAGLEMEKTWQLGALKLSPYLASYYSDMNHQTREIMVNNTPLTQQFGRRFRHEIGLNSGFANWQINAKAGLITGNETSTQRYAGVKLNYQW